MYIANRRYITGEPEGVFEWILLKKW
jgi:hypothetical protein